MIKQIVNRKEVFTVKTHNEVLAAWELFPGCNIFTLDYHTDTRTAFSNFCWWKVKRETEAGVCSGGEERKNELIQERVSQYLNKELSIEQINYDLKYDEHIDFAVQTGLISKAFSFSKNRNETASNPNVYLMHSAEPYNKQSIIEYSPYCIPGCLKEEHDEECLELRADSILEDSFLGEAVKTAESISSTFFDNFILDIDCDFFNTEKSLYPEKDSVFREIIRKARIITIALEPSCVRICSHKGSRLNSRIISERLLTFIERG